MGKQVFYNNLVRTLNSIKLYKTAAKDPSQMETFVPETEPSTPSVSLGSDGVIHVTGNGIIDPQHKISNENDPYFVSDNIVEGATIFGLHGTHKCNSSSGSDAAPTTFINTQMLTAFGYRSIGNFTGSTGSNYIQFDITNANLSSTPSSCVVLYEGNTLSNLDKSTDSSVSKFIVGCLEGGAASSTKSAFVYWSGKYGFRGVGSTSNAIVSTTQIKHTMYGHSSGDTVTGEIWVRGA